MAVAGAKSPPPDSGDVANRAYLDASLPTSSARRLSATTTSRSSHGNHLNGTKRQVRGSSSTAMSTANEGDIIDAPSHIPGLTRSCFSKDGSYASRPRSQEAQLMRTVISRQAPLHRWVGRPAACAPFERRRGGHGAGADLDRGRCVWRIHLLGLQREWRVLRWTLNADTHRWGSQDGRLVTGATDGKVRCFLRDGNEYSFDGFVTSTTGVPVRWLAISPAGDKVAVCSEWVSAPFDLPQTRLRREATASWWSRFAI